MRAVHAWVSGKVQGVYFRASTARKAQSLKLTGWVQNLDDGRVELHAQGPEDAVDLLLKWCESGPILAKVKSVEHVATDIDERLVKFEVRK